MERCGDFAINRCMGRPYVAGHAHNHDHVTQATVGWTLVQMLASDGRVVRETQIVAPQYRALRQMQERYEPHLLTHPWRLADGGVALLLPGDKAPAGATPIPFEPFGAEVEILKGARHALHWLAPDSDWNCIFTWRDPATGETVPYFTGWGAS